MSGRDEGRRLMCEREGLEEEGDEREEVDRMRKGGLEAEERHARW